MKILVDNGHGVETPGKRSPDGRLREYQDCRDIAAALVERLKAAGYDAQLLVPEIRDVPLNKGTDTRVKRVNNICAQLGAANVLLVSIHNNAAGSKGQWLTARGWSGYVAQNASANSKRLAECLADAAAAQGLKVRKPLATQKYWVQSLAICRETKCPAVLTENLFQDNRQDVDYLLTAEGRAAIVQLHFVGILNYLNTK
jgi:N-acetylmuramoyl-L-alanine amidase